METRDSAWSVHPTYAQIQAVLDTLNAGVLVRTVAGQILFANDRMLHWVGYAPEELDGQHVRILVADELQDQVDDELQEIHSGDERLRISIMKRKDGRTLPVVFCPKLLQRDGETVAVVAVVMDLGEVQTARRLDSTADTGLTGSLSRIAGELQALSLFAGSSSVGQVRWDHPDIALITPREREILGELLAGRRVPAIAKALFISPHTVRNHLKSMYRKLDVPDQAALIERIKSLAA